MAHFALAPWAYVVVFLAAGIAGFVDSIAGGGGIITIPVLLAVGLPPHLALGTNKLQSSFGSLAATVKFGRSGLFKLRDIIPGIVATAVGAALGALTVGKIDSTVLSILIPVMLVCILIFLLVKPRFGLEAGKRRLPPLLFWISAGLLLGFYDGFFGPGVGTFWAMALVSLAGLDMQSATAHTKAVNFTSNIVSLIMFFFAGTVVLPIGLIMGAAETAGAYMGSRLVLKRGAALVRVMLITMTCAVLVYLVLKQWIIK